MNSLQKFTQTLKSSGVASDQQVEDFIREFHNTLLDQTEKTWGSCKTEQGQTSYEFLSDVVLRAHDQVIVDLACGTGTVTEAVLKKFPSQGQFVAVDMSAAELKLARDKIFYSKITYLNESVQKLSISSASADYVLCHLGLQLFRPLEPAVKEVRRILKSSGTFAAIIPSLEMPQNLHPTFKMVIQILMEHLSRELPVLSNISWRDGRIRQIEGLHQLFGKHLQFENFEIIKEGSPTEFSENLGAFFYSYSILSPEGHASLKKSWERGLTAFIDAHQNCKIHFPLSRIWVNDFSTDEK